MLLRVAGAGSIHEQHAPDAHHHCQGGQYLLLVRFPSPVMVQQRPVVRFYDQSAVLDLRNENLQLKNQIERLKYELEEKYKSDLATALAEKEKQHEREMAANEAAWRAEADSRSAEARRAADGRLSEAESRHADALRQAEASLAEERLAFQRRLDALAHRADEAVAEKERLEKTVKQEVENQVQAVIQRYNELKQETSSLQSVVEMRGQELRTVTHHLELARIAADEVPTLRERNLTLANTIEDLHAQLERKAAEERRLLSELAKLEAANREASNKIRVLTSLKDQLEYRLQQRHQSPTHGAYYGNDGDRASPVRVHQAPAMTSTPSDTPKAARKTFTFPPSGLSPVILENGLDGENNNVKLSSRKSSGSSSTRRASSDANTSSDADDVFGGPTSAAAAATQLLAGRPADPSTPTVRDVTKKNDSISYVLELGDEQPQTPPSPWQRRRPLGRSYSLRATKHSKSH